MREEGNVRGINTAATLWGSAAVGAAAGADLILEAILATLFVLAANTLLRPVVNTINRKPLDVPSVEVTNTLHLIVESAHQKRVLS
ncbi:MgtC/SapB family protein, partial [Salmonella enterica]